jgi:hypothetical protein
MVSSMIVINYDEEQHRQSTWKAMWLCRKTNLAEKKRPPNFIDLAGQGLRPSLQADFSTPKKGLFG